MYVYVSTCMENKLGVLIIYFVHVCTEKSRDRLTCVMLNNFFTNNQICFEPCQLLCIVRLMIITIIIIMSIVNWHKLNT